MKAIAILSLSLVAGAGAFGLLNWLHPIATQAQSPAAVQSAVPRGEQNNTQPSTSELQEQVRQLTLAVGALRQQGLAAAVAPPAATEQESAPPNIVPSSESKARAREEHEERIADVEAAFRNEGHDPRWSAPTEADIREAVSGANLTQGALQGIQCRSATCRVELTVQDPAAFSREMPNLIGRLPERLHGSAMDFVDNPRGGHTGILYLFR
jgi:hypothetical protein